jgi:hypothetical protein
MAKVLFLSRGVPNPDLEQLANGLAREFVRENREFEPA